ncbi:hypothetical protein, partial [Arenibacter sp. H213]|uniref:hypothetical protein n=1 Tax=Arenibacter sp. H213 TaxID=2183743 RepID=UPI0020435C7E
MHPANEAKVSERQVSRSPRYLKFLIRSCRVKKKKLIFLKKKLVNLKKGCTFAAAYGNGVKENKEIKSSWT